jgi:replicative DNA helicase
MLKDTVLKLEDVGKPESEKFLLGAMLLHADIALPIVRKFIPYPEMFLDYQHQLVYSTILKVADKGQEVDIVSITSTEPSLDFPTLTEYVISDVHMQIGSTVSKAKLETHSQIVREAYLKRTIYQKMVGNESMAEVLAHVAELERKGTDRFLDPKEIIAQVSQTIFSDAPASSLKYPFPMLNKATNGLHKGQYIVVGARPGAGKTTFLENVAFSAASLGKTVLFASAEMPAEDVYRRTLTHMTGINLFFREERLTEEEKIEIDFAMKKLAKMKIYIHEFRSTSQLEAIIKEKHEKGGLKIDLVVVDYIQLLDAKNPSAKNNYERVSSVSRELVAMAKSYKIPFLCAAQLGRGVDGGGQPTYSDFKESGQIEQDADLLLTLWEHKDDPREPRRQRIRIDILKNRNGFTFGNTQSKDFYLLCDRPNFLFSDPTVANAPKF